MVGGRGGGKGRTGRRDRKDRARRLREASNRRAVLPGYPVLPRAMTIEEADDYLAGDPITCLLCGHGFRVLARHLRLIHALSPDAYRERYGLPYSVGLAAVSARARFEAILRERTAMAKPRRGRRRAVPAVTKPPELRGKERHSHYQRLMAVRRLAEVNALPLDFRLGREHLEAFVDRALTGRTLKDVALDPDMPSLAWVRTAFIRWPEVRRRYETAVDALPFPTQALLKRLGPRFAAAVAGLRARGLSIHAVARILGVDAMSVHARLPGARLSPERLGSRSKRR